METIRNFLQRILALEPAVVISTVSGVLLLLANFGVAPAIDVPVMVTTAFNLTAIIATVIGIRQSVYSPATHEREVEEASDFDVFINVPDGELPDASG